VFFTYLHKKRNKRFCYDSIYSGGVEPKIKVGGHLKSDGGAWNWNCTDLSEILIMLPFPEKVGRSPLPKDNSLAQIYYASNLSTTTAVLVNSFQEM